MSELNIKRHLWEPSFPNEIWITDKRKQEEFQITLKRNEDIEIEFTWNYGYGGRGTERMYIPIQLLKELISEIEQK